MGVIKPNSYADEHRLRIPIEPSNQRCYVVSGLADFSAHDAHDDGHPMGSKIHGFGDGSSDKRWFDVEPIHMIVGPKWHEIDDASPTVSVAGISFRDSDETDDLGYEIKSIEWDAFDLPAPDEGFKRVRLKVVIRMCGGEQSTINMLSYHLTILGKLFAAVG